MTGWYVESYHNGDETAQDAADQSERFDGFANALQCLKARKARGDHLVRIMGPQTATDEEHQAIIEVGGVPVF